MEQEVQTHLLEYLLNYFPQFIVVLDSNKQICLKNFSEQDNPDLQRVLNELFVNNKTLNWNNSYSFFLIQDSDIWEIQRYINIIDNQRFEFYFFLKNSNGVASKINWPAISIVDKDFYGSSPFFSYFGNNDSMKSVYESMYQYSTEDEPITIAGEFGSGRSTIAFTICRSNFQNKDENLVYINCPHLSEPHFEKEISLVYNIMEENNSIIFFLQDLSKCSTQIQRKLYNLWIENKSANNIRLIISLHQKVNACIQHGLLDENFIELIKKHHVINVPPLRERLSVLEGLCNMMIYQYNLDFSHHVIGFEPGAMEILKQYQWPNNIHQLNHVMRIMIAQCKEGYIPKKLVEHLIGQESAKLSHQNTVLEINVSNTLQKINYDIVEYVIRQEEGNQTRAAKRLGISRSTLWRMIKKPD